MKFLISFLLLVASLSSYADEAQIVIKQKYGGETILELSTNPVITFTSESMVVTNDFTTITIPFDNVDSYVVSDGATGISMPKAAPQYVNGHVMFSNLPAGSPVDVFTIDGRLVSRLSADSSGNADVSLDALPKGTYIISSVTSKIKVINK